MVSYGLAHEGGHKASPTQTKQNMKRNTKQSVTRVRLQQEKDGTFSFLATTSDEVYKGGMKNMKEVEKLARHNNLEIVFDATKAPAAPTAPQEPQAAPVAPAAPAKPKKATPATPVSERPKSRMARIDELLTSKPGHTVAEIVKTIMAEFPGAQEKATLSSVRTRRYDVRKAIEKGDHKGEITVKDEPKATPAKPTPVAPVAKTKKAKKVTAFPREDTTTVPQTEPAAA